ncbi:MAG: hypothetical protein ABJC26_12110 [Gemmatimonadaceae bacterium]
MNRKLCVLLAASLVFSVLPACEAGSGAGAAGTLTPTISNLTTSGTSVEVSTGTSAIVTFSLSRGGSYDGVVTMSVDGLPSSVTATFDPPGLGVQDPTGKVRFTAASNAPSGSYVVTIRASGPNVTPTSTAFTVKVAVPGVDVKVGAAAVSVNLDSSVAIPVTITRTGGLFDPVTLSAINLPTGITATFSPAVIAPDATTSTMTLSAAINTALGANPITVRATAIGNVDVRTTVPVTVLDATGPRYRIFGAPIVPLDAKVNEATQLPLTLPRAGGFAAPVDLTVENLPAGVTASFSPASAQGISTLTITPALTATEATTTVTIRGKATGLADRTSTFSLHVVQLPGIDIRVVATTQISPNSSHTINVTYVRTGNFSLGYTVSVEGLPSGLTAPGFPLTAPPGSAPTAGGITFVAAASTPLGNYPITFRVVGSDGTTSTKTIAMTVTN